MKAIVLAAGKGVRMNSDLPKVVHELLGKPLICHVIENLKRSGIINDIIVIVGYQAPVVMESVGDSVTYVLQHEQLGTAHAVLQAEEKLKSYTGNVVVACGDAPLVSSHSFDVLTQEKERSTDIKGVVLTAEYEDPVGYGRIVRNNESGYVERIVEEKDANDNEKRIHEINTGTYIFDSRILFSALKKVDTDNAQNEYYLTDVVVDINRQGYRCSAVRAEHSYEGMGVNTRLDLEKISEILRNDI